MFYKFIAKLLIFFALFYRSNNAARNPLRSVVKVTRVHCKSTNPQLMSFEHCQIEQKPNNETLAYTMCHIYEKPLTQINLQMQFFHKRSTGYSPFIIDFKLDWCSFIEKRNNALMQKMFTVFERFSNLNTNCPINLDYVYINMSVSRSGSFDLPFRFPLGEYRVDATITANTAIKLIVSSYLKVD